MEINADLKIIQDTEERKIESDFLRLKRNQT